MSKIDRLVNIIKKLRAPNGCEWDKKQTHESLIPYLIEETYEVVESIEDKNYNLLKEELGDLLLHVIFQIDIANDNKKFSLNDVIDGICEKLIRRHPHIFYDKKDPRYKEENWEVSKKKEKKRLSVLDGVPKRLPQLIRSSRIQEKAASVGFDWNNKNQVLLKVDEEILELKDAILKNEGIDEEIGDVLFTIVNLSRHLGYDADSSLKKSTEKFSKRFKKIEKDLKTKNIKIEDLSLEELDEIWEKNKYDNQN
ncbi:MAG: nucleoside triphosphate pyrophosphohydrolase [Candidatus Marinimicrobia bacterium]|nr:nucleoside triphosphate pyrophosphohydrolase [Candidatus Neomarinimicrobiota bacterium]